MLNARYIHVAFNSTCNKFIFMLTSICLINQYNGYQSVYSLVDVRPSLNEHAVSV